MVQPRRPRWHYLVGGVVCVYLLAGSVGSVVEAANTRGWLGAVAIVALQVVGVGCSAIAFRGHERALELLLAALATGLVSQVLTEYSGTGILFLVVWIAPFRTRLLHAVLLAALSIGGFVASTLVNPVPSSAVVGISAGLGWALFLAALLHQLAVTRNQSAAVAQARSSEAVLAERQRLAREIHDVLAHSLSAQVVHLEGTRLLLERGCDPALVLERVTQAGDLARAGLDETKRAVEALRGIQAPLADQLEQLAMDFRAVTGTSCSVLVTGDERQLAPETQLTVLRTAQEALTNVHKHAPDAEVTMALHRAGGWCELDIRDTGGDPGNLANAGNGYGLVGMRERAELIGGNLDAGPDGQGFRVRLRVPA